jgi:carbamoyl-phosphate synthase large subunit
MGGPLGVSIFKALRQSAVETRIVATDAEPLSVGLFRADVGHVLPRITVDERAYLDRLIAICLEEQVSMVCLASDIEMRRLAPHMADIEARTGARLVLNSPACVESFMDKWETVRLLRERSLPVPDSVLATDADAMAAFLSSHPFPLVMKPRIGSGSTNVTVVLDADELAARQPLLPDAIVQEYLLPDDEEYTVGVYKSQRTGYVGQIVMRRSLVAGLTYRAEVVQDDEIEAVCRAVVDSFDVWGPINVQLRKTAEGVRVFEINPRFSSTTVIRAHFGFNEPEMCLRELVLGERLPSPETRQGFALRYWDEVYFERSDVLQNGSVRPGTGRRGTTLDIF